MYCDCTQNFVLAVTLTVVALITAACVYVIDYYRARVNDLGDHLQRAELYTGIPFYTALSDGVTPFENSKDFYGSMRLRINASVPKNRYT
jgi:hypothetical protein